MTRPDSTICQDCDHELTHIVETSTRWIGWCDHCNQIRPTTSTEKEESDQ